MKAALKIIAQILKICIVAPDLAIAQIGSAVIQLQFSGTIDGFFDAELAIEDVCFRISVRDPVVGAAGEAAAGSQCEQSQQYARGNERFSHVHSNHLLIAPVQT